MKYVIVEVANTHGGDITYLNRLIDDFSALKDGFGIKFQPLHPDRLATPDFQWYPVYQELLFSSDEWKGILNKANETKDVWIDVFDSYGIQIIEENIDVVYGVKLQVSVLFNNEVIKSLAQLPLSDKKMIINVAALNFDEIKYFISKIEKEINPSELLLEVGFQGYPTQLLDSGISKIKTVKEQFNKRIVFADHIDKDDDYAIWLPILAVANEADVIEKHVMLADLDTKYDFYSSINKNQFDKMINLLGDYQTLVDAPFLNQKEKLYLTNSIMKPLLKESKSIGQLVDLNTDFDFRRSGSIGLNAREIQGLQSNFHILSSDKKKGQTLSKEDFKKANIAVIVACRLKSSRLKEKAILKIGDLSSVEYCLRNACKFDNVNSVVLATSDLPLDDELQNYTYKDSVLFHRGDPEDVIRRYLGVINSQNIDVVIRVTADMPFIDNEICQILLKEHFESGADYTVGKTAAVGTNLEIINAHALRTVKDHFPNAEYSEYMTWYFQNNPEYFKLNFVDLPKELVRDYRLTLDYDEDLILFNKLHAHLEEKGDHSLRAVFEVLDANEDLPKINSHISLKYKTDEALIKTLNEKTKIKS